MLIDTDKLTSKHFEMLYDFIYKFHDAYWSGNKSKEEFIMYAELHDWVIDVLNMFKLEEGI